MTNVKKVAVSAGAVGTLVAGLALILSWRSKSFQDWKKRQIENVYYDSIDERDVAWG